MSDAPSEAESIMTGQAAQPAATVKTGPEGAPEQKFTSTTEIATMNDLKTRAPELHQAMLEGIAQNIVKDMQKHQRRFKKLMRESRRR